MSSDNGRKTIKFKCVEIYGAKVFVYDSRDEDAPWKSAEYVPDVPDENNQVGMSWANNPPWRQTAIADLTIQEFWTDAAWNSARSLVTPNQAANAAQPSSKVPVRAVILDLACTADSLVYNLIYHIASNDRVTDSAIMKKVKKQLWIKTRRKFDFFSQDLDLWLPLIGERAQNATTSLGYKDIEGGGRLPWVQLLSRLRGRFVHRSSFFLEYDFQEMKKYLGFEEGQALSHADLFNHFVADVANKLRELSNCCRQIISAPTAP